jgi:hypothetical protein
MSDPMRRDYDWANLRSPKDFVLSDEKLSAFLELESVIRASGDFN